MQDSHDTSQIYHGIKNRWENKSHDSNAITKVLKYKRTLRASHRFRTDKKKHTLSRRSECTAQRNTSFHIRTRRSKASSNDNNNNNNSGNVLVHKFISNWMNAPFLELFPGWRRDGTPMRKTGATLSWQQWCRGPENVEVNMEVFILFRAPLSARGQQWPAEENGERFPKRVSRLFDGS